MLGSFHFCKNKAVGFSDLSQMITAKDSNEGSTLRDEFCNDDIYLKDAGTDQTLLEEILATPTNQKGWNDMDVENLLEYNLKILGINLTKVKINRC